MNSVLTLFFVLVVIASESVAGEDDDLMRCASPGQTFAADHPNIILFLVDDLGWTDAGCFGSDFYETPSIDRLAEEGMRFTRAYANAANCMPSRASLMTGQYTPRHGIYNIASPQAAAISEPYRKLLKQSKLIPVPNQPGLKGTAVTLPEALNAAGYRTGFIGKWHHAQSEKQSDFDVTHVLPPSWRRSGTDATKEAIEAEPKLTSRITRLAAEFIEETGNEPFLLFLSYHSVHLPVVARAETIKKYENKLEELSPAERKKLRHSEPGYAAMVEETDTSVGRVLEELQRRGLAKSTVVVFFSDNGGHNRVTSNLPLRGEKQMVYEGGIRVPLIVRWPGKVKVGSMCDEPVIGTDFYPTFLDLAGSPPPEKHPLDGVSLVDLWRGKTHTLKREALFWHTPSYWHKCQPSSVILKGNFKLIEWFEDNRVEMFDLATDPGEMTNLSDSHPEKLAELHGQLKEWREQIGAPIPTKMNPDYEPEG